jgi:phosphate acetyltransferase
MKAGKVRSMGLRAEIMRKASGAGGHIVLAEGADPRVAAAGCELARRGIAQVTLLGSEAEVRGAIEIAKAAVPATGLDIVDVALSPCREAYAAAYAERRARKGGTLEDARRAMLNPLFFAAQQVASGDADGAVMGAVNTTADVLRAAIRVVGTAPGTSIVSSSFVMILPDRGDGERVLLFADCAVMPDPTAPQLAEIAWGAVQTWRSLMADGARVAFLSFSTKGSAEHELVDKVREATGLFQSAHPEIPSDGELQLDAALVPGVGLKKAPGSRVAGDANVLVFPDLNSGNIGYKLTQRLADATALGPLMQGLRRPVQDLSRGCSASDIVETSAITVLLSRGG